ncbi:MAG: cystathionine gamma-synthase [Streptococcus sp.]|nr:cystathionine gamma-synthase [Streptococcus sp.]
MTDKNFPQVADDEIMLTEMPHMNLYDELDFISNIMGDYTDRNYLEWAPIVDSKKHAPLTTGNRILQQQVISRDFKKPIDKKDPAIRYAEQAREQARADLKKKRSAPYLTSDLPHKNRNRKLPSKQDSEKPKPTALFQKTEGNDLAEFGNKLRQEQYILADIKPDYSPPVQKVDEEKPKKNNYDFLKTSQIYNKGKSLEEAKRQAIAQELNLTKLE